MSRPAVIAGSSGLVGGFCLEALLEHPEFNPVISLARKGQPRAHAKLRQVQTDFETIGDLGPLDNGAVFCALGTTIRKAGSKEAFRKVDFDCVMHLAQATRKAGATSFALVSSIGADAGSSNFYLGVKGEVHAALRGLGFRCLHVFEPSFLMGERTESRSGERIGIAIAKATQFLLVGGLTRYRPLEARHVGRAMVGAVLREDLGERLYRWDEIRRLNHA